MGPQRVDGTVPKHTERGTVNPHSVATQEIAADRSTTGSIVDTIPPPSTPPYNPCPAAV